jgi:hypothetical protein
MGSTLDMVTFGISHKLSRVWSGQATVGVAKNRASASFPSYNSWNFGAGVNRPIGRNFLFAIAYNGNISTNTQTGCTGSSCSSNQLCSYNTVNLQWHSRPLVLP